jgi:uncharacterized protein
MILSKARRRLAVSYAIIAAWMLAAPSFAAPTTTEMVPMRDGTRLMTDIYLPSGSGPFPAIVARTPYPRDAISWPAFNLAGYAIVVQSTRGRFGSEGAGHMIFVDDAWGANQDGFDCIEWVARQPWCSGQVGTIGISAIGITQYLMAGSMPPHLSCQFVMLAPCSLYQYAMFQGGALRKEQVENWLSGYNFDPVNLQMIREHPDYDDLYRSLDLSTRFGKVNVPVLHVAGWYDTFLQGNLDAFMGLQSRGGKGARGRQKLIIGPYVHGTPKPQVGELEYPNAVPQNAILLYLGWYQRWLKGQSPGADDAPAVAYYVMGACGEEGAPGNEWRSSDTWPIPSIITPYYLQPNGSISPLKPAAKSASKTYTFDPSNPVPTVGGSNLTIPAGPMDQRKVEDRADVVLFTSEPLGRPTEVTGRIKMKLWASSSCKNTDFTAKLTDVYPDGRSMLVCDGIVRAKYRKSLEKPKLITPGKIYEFEIDLWSTSIIFNKGHRIRLAISSSNTPRFDVNPNTGEPIFKATGKQPAKNTIYFDASHPSAVYLPVVGSK